MALLSTLRSSLADKDWRFIAVAIAAPVVILGGMWAYNARHDTRKSEDDSHDLPESGFGIIFPLIRHVLYERSSYFKR